MKPVAKEPYKFYLLNRPTYWIAGLFFTVSFYTNFLSNQDAIFLFNRLNHFESNLFIYSDGFNSITIQLIAIIGKSLPPFFQAFIYTISAFLLFIVMLTYLDRITKASWFSLFLVLYLSVFGRIFFISLSNSLWVAFILVGLIGVSGIIQNRNLKLSEFFLVILCAFTSPLSVCLALVYIYKIIRKRSDILSYPAVLFLIAPLFLLVDPVIMEKSIFFWFDNLANLLTYIASAPKQFFGFTDLDFLNDIPFVFGWFSVLISLWALIYVSIKRKRSPTFNVTLLRVIPLLLSVILVSLLCLIVSPPSSIDFTKGSAFPITTCGLLVLAVTLKRHHKWVFILLSIPLFFLSALTNFERIPTCDNCSQEFQKLIEGNSTSQIISRSGENNVNEWSIAFGNHNIHSQDCMHESLLMNSADYFFRIQCNSTGFAKLFAVYPEENHRLRWVIEPQGKQRNLNSQLKGGIDLHLNNWTLFESALNRVRKQLIPKLNLVVIPRLNFYIEYLEQEKRRLESLILNL